MKKILLALIFIFLYSTNLFAQYWGERVMEKSFEHTDFFFMPYTLNPYGISGFKLTTPGLIDDPLVNLSVNPALIYSDSIKDNYLYFDFRSAKTITEGNSILPCYTLDYRSSFATDVMYYRPYPWIYVNTRRELEPVFSGGYIGSPLTGFVVGATYQLVLQDGKYYDVPQNIYKSTIGADYAGNRAAAESTLPIVDKYSGEDKMHQLGHFISAFGKFEIPLIGDIGLKISRVLFDRSGSIGSKNLWDSYYYRTSSSLYSNMETRKQDYDHWEASVGAQLNLSNQFSIGATIGQLWGQANQSLLEDDSSHYNYSSSNYGSYYISAGRTRQNWKHDGTTNSLGINLLYQPSEKYKWNIIYQRISSSIDLDLMSNINDTSFSTYSYLYNDTMRTSTSYYFLRDNRKGNGEQTILQNKIQISLQWQIDERANLSLGLQYEFQNNETNTSENIKADMLSYYKSGYDNYSWLSGNTQLKELRWKFTAEKTSLIIPVIFSYKVSKALSLMCGLNRVMTQTNINEVTLAIFNNRKTNYNGAITDENNFGERYTTPEEIVSDIKTTFLGGITISPSEHFSIRLLGVPSFRDTYDGTKMNEMQWWLSVRVAP